MDVIIDPAPSDHALDTAAAHATRKVHQAQEEVVYTMPGGQEDPLIRLSERMVRHAREQARGEPPAR